MHMPWMRGGGSSSEIDLVCACLGWEGSGGSSSDIDMVCTCLGWAGGGGSKSDIDVVHAVETHVSLALYLHIPHHPIIIPLPSSLRRPS